MNARAILIQVAADHGLTVDALRSADRRRKVAHARFDAFARLRALHIAPGRHKFSLPQIGRFLGDRDHTTVIHGIRKAAELYGPRAPVYPVLESEETRL
jgi:chromosomal replication initiator protein